jgi:hypothetical protein
MVDQHDPLVPEGFEVPDLPLSGTGSNQPTPVALVEPGGKAPDSYRTLLLKLEEKSQSTFDKTLVTLAGGALGVSLAFVKDLLGGYLPVAPAYLLTAWLLWTVSLASTLTSHYTSAGALRRAIRSLDRGEMAGPSNNWADKLTGLLNATALLSFLAGLVAAGVFVFHNLRS